MPLYKSTSKIWQPEHIPKALADSTATPEHKPCGNDRFLSIARTIAGSPEEQKPSLFPIDPDRLYRIGELLGPGRLPISRAAFYASWVKESGLELIRIGPRTTVVKGSSLIAVLAKRISSHVSDVA